jgi:hypothetical protein
MPGTRALPVAVFPPLDRNANREMFEEGVEILFKAFEGKPFSHKGQVLDDPARGAISRLDLEGDHPGAGAAAAAGRMLAADIASSREQAMREAAPHCEENVKMFGDLRLVPALVPRRSPRMTRRRSRQR